MEAEIEKWYILLRPIFLKYTHERDTDFSDWIISDYDEDKMLKEMSEAICQKLK